MASFNKFQDFVEQLGKGVHQLHAAGHTLKVFLTNQAPAATNTVKADITEITAQNGYPAGYEDKNTWSWDITTGTHSNTEHATYNSQDALRCSHTGGVLKGVT